MKKQLKLTPELLEKVKKFPKFKPEKVPDHLKPENFEVIQKRLLNILNTGHGGHGGQIDRWLACATCAEAFMKYKEEKKKMGFVSTANYLQWEKENVEKRGWDNKKLFDIGND